jgi:glycosyltransferase involved in cell wall biosynthesis
LLISIIIPTYNSGHTLEACLKSIITQQYHNFEVWIIDGVSADDTLSLIKKYAASYSFIHFISEHDQGIYDAMNKGIDLCSGQWIYFLGSDDTLYNTYVLSSIAAKIEKNNADVIYGDVIMRGENQWNLNNVIFNGEYNLEKLLHMTINHQAIFYNKAVFQKCGLYNLQYSTNADYDFNLRCYASASFQYVNIIVANFFVGGQSTNFPNDAFQKHRGGLFVKYFGRKIFNRSFIKSRLYLQQAVFSKSSPLNLWERIFCLTAYMKLKIQSVFI